MITAISRHKTHKTFTNRDTHTQRTLEFNEVRKKHAQHNVRRERMRMHEMHISAEKSHFVVVVVVAAVVE